MRNSEFPAFLYVLEDPREPGNIRYIGATGSPPTRLTQHKKRAKMGHPAPLYVWWRELQSVGAEPVLRLFWQGSPKQRDEMEIKAVRGYRKLGFSLFNATDGGSTPHHCSEETREKLRVASLGRRHSTEARQKMSSWHSGKKLSAETRKRMSESRSELQKGIYPESLRRLNEANRGVPRTDEVKRKISAARKGKPLSDEHKRKISVGLLARKGENSCVEKTK